MSGAPRRAIDKAEAALARIDALGRGHVAAAVLVGSAVLGDWREDRSDVDLLLVSGEGVTPPVREAWRQAARLGGARTDLVIADPGDLSRAGYDLDLAVALQTAGQCGHGLRGAPPPAPDRARLDAILEDNLASYWRSWLARARGRGLGWPTGAMFTPFGAVWVLGGMARIRSTLADGRIVSKREAMNRALARLPAHRVILDEAGRLRDGAAPRLGRLERRRLALACADDLLARRW